MASQRMYCEQWHPGGDQEADQWCQMYHWIEGYLAYRSQLPSDADTEAWNVVNGGHQG